MSAAKSGAPGRHDLRRQPARASHRFSGLAGSAGSCRCGRGDLLLVAAALGLYGDATTASTSRIQTLAYVMMALGLNIVVGFAGLLDLGYVAFFAIGAFVSGWLMSGFFDTKNIHIVVSDITQNLPGIHVNFFFVIFIAAAFTAMWGAILGAPTLRLRGDYLAIVTLAFGEIVRACSSSRATLRPRRTPTAARASPRSTSRRRCPGLELNITARHHALLLHRARDDAGRAVRQRAPARLAPRPRLDRGPRGRGRGRCDGRPPRAREAWAYAIGASIGGFAGVFLGASRTPSTSTSSSSASRSSSSA